LDPLSGERWGTSWTFQRGDIPTCDDCGLAGGLSDSPPAGAASSTMKSRRAGIPSRSSARSSVTSRMRSADLDHAPGESAGPCSIFFQERFPEGVYPHSERDAEVGPAKIGRSPDHKGPDSGDDEVDTERDLHAKACQPRYLAGGHPKRSGRPACRRRTHPGP